MISTFSELLEFLEKENNSYSHFILERIHRAHSSNLSVFKNVKTQKHHILPSHQGGPNEDWNLIILTFEEHTMAHQFRYENYNQIQDLGASLMIGGQVIQGLETIRQLALSTMRKNQTGRFNSILQSDLGSRPKKKRACYARNRYIVAALERGFSLAKQNAIVTIGPCECTSLVSVIDKLMHHPEMSSIRSSWDLCQKKEKHYVLTSLTRTLTGHIDKKSGKSVFTFLNWRVLGINICVD